MAHGIMHAMKATTVPIDKAGRVVLPKWVREGANLLPGDELTVSLEGQRIQYAFPLAWRLGSRGGTGTHPGDLGGDYQDLPADA